MCGIAGLVGTTPLDPEARARAGRMRDIMAHRGPDGFGLQVDTWAALAHRRLSIVDLAGGHQPLANEDGSIWVTYNGEIYNHAAVRRDLEAHGHRYRTKSDTETIVHAYEQWGDDCVLRFRGMFAFAIWDQPRRRLLLVRDRLGIKPLYWTMAGDRLLFGSEIKALLASGLVPATVNRRAIPELLATRYVSGDETLFQGIYKLQPGHRLIYENGRVAIAQYWDVPADGGAALPRDPQARRERERALVDRFAALLDESVRLRLMADVPLGVFLSGGIDSSAIAALMARAVDRPVKSFSVAFADRAYSELGYAREVAEAIGADQHEIVIDDAQFFGALPRLVWHEDEPIAHPSSVPLHFVSALAREHVKVVLTGEGSDELLGGYGRYPRAILNWEAGARYDRLLPGTMRRAVAEGLVPRLPARLRRYAERSFLAVPHDPAHIFFDTFAGIGLAAQARLLAPAALDGMDDPYAASVAAFQRPNGRSTTLDRLLYADIKTYLVELLMKQDQMSMSTSVESRVPFLDHVLVEFAAALPNELRLNGWTTKRILREAARGLLPPSILTRPKMGFPVPFAGWMRGPWASVAREVLLDRRSRERGIVNPRAVERLLADHQAGTCNGGDALWALVNLELWHRTFIDGAGVQVLPSPKRGADPLDTSAPPRESIREGGRTPISEGA